MRLSRQLHPDHARGRRSAAAPRAPREANRPPARRRALGPHSGARDPPAPGRGAVTGPATGISRLAPRFDSDRLAVYGLTAAVVLPLIVFVVLPLYGILKMSF